MASIINKAMQTVAPLIDQKSHTISLAVARDKELLEGFRKCDYIEIDSISAGGLCQLRFNSLSNPEYEAGKYRRFMTTPEMPFEKLYLTNKAQAGFSLVLKCGGDATMKAERESAITEITNPVPIAAHSQLGQGEKLVGSAGTRETLVAATESIKGVFIKALLTNTDAIYVGNVTVAAANGYPLGAGETIYVDIDDAVKVYLDAAVGGEGVRYLFVET